jgi:hypothetical protein
VRSGFFGSPSMFRYRQCKSLIARRHSKDVPVFSIERLSNGHVA